MINMTNNEIDKLVDEFKTRYEYGFTGSEIYNLLLHTNAVIDMGKFMNSMRGNTGILIDGDFITYYCDVKWALKTAIVQEEDK